MTGRLSRLALVIVSLCLPAANKPAAAQDVPASRAMRTLLPWAHQGDALERFLNKMHHSFRQSDADGDGLLTMADSTLRTMIGAASMRAALALEIARADLDRDGVVTADELRRFVQVDRRGQAGTAAAPEGDQVEETIRRLMQADTNKDGRITWLEMVAYAKLRQKEMERGFGSAEGVYREFLQFDADGDGQLTPVEYETAAAALFQTVDTDGDGTATREELAAYRTQPVEPKTAAFAAARVIAEQRQQVRSDTLGRVQAAAAERARQEAAARASCAMPKPSDSARIIAFSANITDALSSLALGTQDKITHTAKIVVEPGSAPLYVVLNAEERTIWRFAGAVERVERLVLANNGGVNDGSAPLAGVTGVPTEKVTFLGRRNCLPLFWQSAPMETTAASDAIARDTGRKPDLIAAAYEVVSVSVPSGQLQEIRDGDRKMLMTSPDTRDLVKELYHHHPGGVVAIDPAWVVANTTVVRYEILPREAGLIQLIESGAVTQTRPSTFVINRKIKFPVGLDGLVMTFLLPSGVPMPDGDWGLATLISEETGKRLSKPQQR
ncbi:MAG: hypothetical protein QOI12_2524 [Alphaproteobacteria bacterium]|jgi:Ca2+-binding EF-hand superfamily protein|nr:hypothetical protein [Alphaproteobacteria bacterium]